MRWAQSGSPWGLSHDREIASDQVGKWALRLARITTGSQPTTPRSPGRCRGSLRDSYDLAGHGDGVTICDSFGNVSRQTIKDFRDATLQVIPWSAAGIANGVAELDPTGRVPSVQLPSYVDDVVEVANCGAAWHGRGHEDLHHPGRQQDVAVVRYRLCRDLRVAGPGRDIRNRLPRRSRKAAYDHSQAAGNPHGTTAAQVGALPVNNPAFTGVLTGAARR